MSKSLLDWALDAWAAQHDLPAPVREYRFHPPRRWRFDYCWLPHKVALELEGGIWTGGRHVRGRGYLGDLEKYNRAQLDGWIVLRCATSEATSQTTVGMIREALARRTA